MTRKPIIHHPGKILKEEFLIPAQISSAQLARDINVSNKAIKEIIAKGLDIYIVGDNDFYSQREQVN